MPRRALFDTVVKVGFTATTHSLHNHAKATA